MKNKIYDLKKIFLFNNFYPYSEIYDHYFYYFFIFILFNFYPYSEIREWHQRSETSEKRNSAERLESNQRHHTEMVQLQQKNHGML